MKIEPVQQSAEKSFEAYLDIETTGLSQWLNDITVIGIFRCNGTENDFMQFYGREITRDNILSALNGVHTIYTYNGKRFDIPFIEAFLGINLEASFNHDDLMYKCWARNLKGGFKSVEKQLGIERETQGVDGLQAVWLWNQYLDCNDEEALNLLLKYNRDDVVNLKTLKEKLQVEESQ